jgi:DNA-binding GntR family transcriptional regulator
MSLIGVHAAGVRKKDQIYDRMLLDIIYGDLRPGSTLDEVGLARRYRTGQAGVRDALFRLALEGLVHRRPRLGTTVADLSVSELQDVSEARQFVECRCARLAAERATFDDIAELRTAFEGVDEILERRDFRALVQMDQGFHRTVARASQNESLHRFATVLHNNALRFWYFSLLRRSDNVVRGAIAHHLEVLAAIERRDPPAAEQAMGRVVTLLDEHVSQLLVRAPLQPAVAGAPLP